MSVERRIPTKPAPDRIPTGVSRVGTPALLVALVPLLLSCVCLAASATAAGAGGTGHGLQSFDLVVPRAPTPVTVHGVENLVYELHLSSFAPVDLMITRIEVLDAGRPGGLVATFDGPEVAELLGGPRIGGEGAERRVIAPGTRAVAYFWLRPDPSRAEPETIAHRIIYREAPTTETAGASGVEGGHADVLAVADARVAAVRDSIPESPTIPSTPHELEESSGNYVTLDLGGGRYVHYEHLLPGSVRVVVGDRVREGDVVARVGYSGDSVAPHLHMHVSDGATPLAGEGIPWELRTFDVLGSYSSLPSIDSFAEGVRWEPAPPGAPPSRSREFPGELNVVAFPPGPGAPR